MLEYPEGSEISRKIFPDRPTIHHVPAGATYRFGERPGQTMIIKTRGRTVEQDTIVPEAMIAATLGDGAKATRKLNNH